MPHLHSKDPLHSLHYGFYSWVKDIVEEVVEDAVDCGKDEEGEKVIKYQLMQTVQT